MRLWHKNLIRYLPRKQLVGQWREACMIAKAVKEGMLNHVLVNRVKDYPIEHLYAYGVLVSDEMDWRGFGCQFGTFGRYFDVKKLGRLPIMPELFAGWHNERYLKQCCYNLQEKFDCGGISREEWEEVLNVWDGGCEF